jgi:hypothetical protein
MRCKNCKEIFTPKQFNRKYCVKDECNNLYFEDLKTQALKRWNKEKKVKKQELQTIQELIKVAQVVFNKWIRKRDAGLNCISCQKPAKKENAGHYYNANNHWNVRFNEENCHLQCEFCNTHLHANLINYQIEIQKKIGADRLILLHEEAHKTKKFTREELHEIIKKYKLKLKETI